MSNTFLRVKQLRSCPYISFKFLNLINILNHLGVLAVAVVLFLELQQSHPVYTYGYLAISLSGITFSAISFDSASSLLVMARYKRKWVLWIIYILQLGVFITHLVISISLWLNFKVLSQLVALNQHEYLEQIDAFKNIAIFLGVSALIQGLIAWIALYFRKFLGREQIRVEDNKKRLREFEMYDEAVQHLFKELNLERNQTQPLIRNEKQSPNSYTMKHQQKQQRDTEERDQEINESTKKQQKRQRK